MSTTPHHTLSHSLLNVLLVLIESALTLLLRFDSQLRRCAYPLAKAQAIVCIRTYLPHTQIYATFDYKGVLLDDHLPAGKSEPDVIINAYSHQLLAMLFSHNPDQVDELQIRGQAEEVQLVKAFLMHVGFGGVIQALINKIKPKSVSPEQKAAQKEDKIAKLSEKLAQKTALAEKLNTENRRLAISLKEIQSKQKSTFMALMVAIGVALIAIIAHFFR